MFKIECPEAPGDLDMVRAVDSIIKFPFIIFFFVSACHRITKTTPTRFYWVLEYIQRVMLLSSSRASLRTAS
jgi:hypothetical protein